MMMPILNFFLVVYLFFSEGKGEEAGAKRNNLRCKFYEKYKYKNPERVKKKRLKGGLAVIWVGDAVFFGDFEGFQKPVEAEKERLAGKINNFGLRR